MTAYCPLREIISLKEADAAQVDLLAQQLCISPVLARILVCRGLMTYDQCERFFRPDCAGFHDPYLFPDMERAVGRIIRAIHTGEKIIVYGDYDVDGVTATVLLVRVLGRLGADVGYYLPNRLTEGYGVSREGIDDIRQRQAGLVITVDCGISAGGAIAYAATKDIDVIVTDHHEPHDHMPQAFAVIDPKVPACPYPDENLAGVGVAFKLSQALVKAMDADASIWQGSLDLVSLGTAADIVPLIGENRIIVKLGFEQMSHTTNIGLRHLVSLQGLAGKNLSTSDVVFLLAPCINAAGRLGESLRGAKLLLCDNEGEAALYAAELVEMNRERRALDAYVQEQAASWVMQHVDLDRELAIVAGMNDWHVGVIGIAASKMVEKFCRPTFLFSIQEDGYARGSGRSVRGLHLLEALNDCRDLLENYGGHAAAAGASIKVENLPQLRERFNEAVQSRISMDQLVPHVHVDAEVDIAGLTPKFFRILKQMEPFGPGNMRPVLVCHGLKHRYEPRIVGNRHLKMTVAKHGHVMDAIAFNFSDRLAELRYSEAFSLAFSLDENTWNGRTTLQMKVKGVAL